MLNLRGIRHFKGTIVASMLVEKIDNKLLLLIALVYILTSRNVI